MRSANKINYRNKVLGSMAPGPVTFPVGPGTSLGLGARGGGCQGAVRGIQEGPGLSLRSAAGYLGTLAASRCLAGSQRIPRALYRAL